MSERNYGIDFLRLILMFMICMLHVLSQGGIMDAVIETDIAYRYAIYSFLYVVSYCGVDGFALISGYAASDKNRKYTIIINMWFQAFFYSFILTVILTIMGYNDGVGMKDLIKAAMPVSFNVFWYFTGYFVLFFAMPVLNKYLFSIDILTAKKSLAVTVILFSFVGLISDAFKTNWGGGTLGIIILYCIGVLAKRINLFQNIKAKLLICMWLLSILISWGVLVTTGITRLVRNNSPTIILSAFIMVVLFSRMKLSARIIEIIKICSPLVFGIYLFQLNQVVWNHFLYSSFSFVAGYNLVFGVLYIFGFALVIFILGLSVDFIRSRLFKLFRISYISEKIVALFNRF